MSNSSASAGTLNPKSTNSYGGLTLTQFLQNLLVGLSEIPGDLVRPKWQVEPPKNPDISVNWIGFGLSNFAPDFNAYVDMDEDDNAVLQRQEGFQLQCTIYGPDAIDTYGLIRDGVQIQQNLAAITAAGLGFVEITPGLRIPDLINERWCNRTECSLVFRRQIRRTYPILPLVSAAGKIHTVVGDEDYLVEWQVEN